MIIIAGPRPVSPLLQGTPSTL